MSEIIISSVFYSVFSHSVVLCTEVTYDIDPDGQNPVAVMSPEGEDPFIQGKELLLLCYIVRFHAYVLITLAYNRNSTVDIGFNFVRVEQI